MFETLAVRQGRPMALEAHWARLAASQRTVNRPAPPASARRQVMAAAKALGRGGLRVEWVTSAIPRSASLSILPRPRRSVTLLQRGVAVVTASARVPSPAVLPTEVKSGERVPGVLAWGERPPGSAFERLSCNDRGWLTEGTVSNLFLVRGGVLVTPPTWAGVLPGVVRAAVLRVARRLRIPVAEQPVTRHELFTASEAFLTNSLIGLVPIRVADGRRIGERCPGPITRRLQRAYPVRPRRSNGAYRP